MKIYHSPPTINTNYIYNEKEALELRKAVYDCFNNKIDEWIPCRDFLLKKKSKLKENKLLFTFEFLKIFYLEYNNLSQKKNYKILFIFHC